MPVLYLRTLRWRFGHRGLTSSTSILTCSRDANQEVYPSLRPVASGRPSKRLSPAELHDSRICVSHFTRRLSAGAQCEQYKPICRR